MHKTTSWIIVGIAIIVAVIVVFGINSTKQTTPAPEIKTPETTNNVQSAPESNPIPETVLPKTHYVNITSYQFIPNSLTINKDDTVIWTNADYVVHTVSSDISRELDSGRFSTGVQFSHKFNTTGTYKYHCNIHPNMKGTITVQ